MRSNRRRRGGGFLAAPRQSISAGVSGEALMDFQHMDDTG